MGVCVCVYTRFCIICRNSCVMVRIFGCDRCFRVCTFRKTFEVDCQRRVGAVAGEDAYNKGTDLIDNPCSAKDARLQARDDDAVEHIEWRCLILVTTEDNINGQKQCSADKGDNTVHDILHAPINTSICRDLISRRIIWTWNLLVAVSRLDVCFSEIGGV